MFSTLFLKCSGSYPQIGRPTDHSVFLIEVLELEDKPKDGFYFSIVSCMQTSNIRVNSGAC